MKTIYFILHFALSHTDTHVENATAMYLYDSQMQCETVAEVVNDLMPELHYFCTTEDQAINY